MKIVPIKDASGWPDVSALSPDQLKEAYALARASFTAEDLQKFTELDEQPLPLDQLLRELEVSQQEHDRKSPHDDGK